MTDRELSSGFTAGFYLAFVTWTVLIALVVRHLLKKDHQAFRITLLYLINSLVFLLAWGMIMKLALYVLGPKDAEVLRRTADDHYWSFIRSTVWTVLALFVGNVLFLKVVAKIPPWKHSLILIAADAVILLSASYVSAEWYYQGLLPDTR